MLPAAFSVPWDLYMVVILEIFLFHAGILSEKMVLVKIEKLWGGENGKNAFIHWEHASPLQIN